MKQYKFGASVLLASVVALAAGPAKRYGNVRDFARGAAQSDDITAMVLRYGQA